MVALQALLPRTVSVYEATPAARMLKAASEYGREIQVGFYVNP